MTTRRLRVTVLTLALCAGSTALAQPFGPPPPPPVAVVPVPVRPATPAVWVPAHYRLTPAGYRWIPGHWAAPRPGRFVPGHWSPRGWIPEHWAR